MKIDERTVGDVTVLDMQGKLLIGEGDELLRERINNLVEDKDPAQLGRRTVYGQCRARGSGSLLHHREQEEREAQAGKSDEASRGLALDYQVAHGFRNL